MKVVTGGKKFKLEGIPEMKKCLTEIRKTLNAEGNVALAEIVRKGLLVVANMVAEQSRGVVPVVTGNLKDAIGAKEGQGAAAVAFVDAKKAPYARMVEKGTSKMPASPYFRPAVRATRRVAAPVIAREIYPAISKAAAMNAWKAPGK